MMVSHSFIRFVDRSLVLLAAVIMAWMWGVAGIGAAMLGLIGGAFLVWIAPRVVPPSISRWVLWAYALRLLLALGLFTLSQHQGGAGYWGFSLDSHYYDTIGRQIADRLRDLKTTVGLDIVTNYTYVVGVLYLMFGKHLVIIDTFNSLVGTIEGIAVYRLMKAIGASTRDASRATLLTLFFPSLFLWSTQALKDVFALTITTVLLLLYVKQFWTGSRIQIILIPLLTLILNGTRLYLGVIITAVSFGFLAAGRLAQKTIRLRDVLLVVLVAVAFQASGLGILGSRMLQTVSFGDLSRLRSTIYVQAGPPVEKGAARPAQSDTVAPVQHHNGALEDVDISTATKAMAFMPRAFASAFLEPLPPRWFVGGGVIQKMAAPEVVLWYILLVAAARGVYKGIKGRLYAFLYLMVAAMAMAVPIGLVMGNIGAIYRERAVIEPLIFALAALGLSHRTSLGEGEAQADLQ